MQFVNDAVFRLARAFRRTRLLSLTTVGARSGQQRRSTVQYFPEHDNTWLIVASKGGAAQHPAWFFNLAKNPNQVWAEIGSRKVRVLPETLSGEVRASAWQRITAQSPNFAGYETKTDREIPVVRLTTAAA
jgi:deazaflavin-dependent oxidoreductase (nitroreductase family)